MQLTDTNTPAYNKGKDNFKFNASILISKIYAFFIIFLL